MTGAAMPVMAAMMLPGAAPTVLDRVRADGRVRAGVLFTALFAGSYFAVWTVVGLGLAGLPRPHGMLAAGALTVAAGLYELTPLKRRCRRRCRELPGSGLVFGAYCVGSSIGLMVMLIALGLMSFAWMAAVAVLVLGQKLVPAKPLVDVPVALAIVALGVVVVLAPSAVPALMPSM